MPRRRTRPKGITQEALTAYAERGRLLARMGFASYEEYLASDLWRDIRLRKAKAEDGRCFGCGKQTRQVHHGAYDEDTLLGRVLSRLYMACDACHRKCEFFGGLKCGPAQATALLMKIRERNLPPAPPLASDFRRLLERDEPKSVDKSTPPV